ncbi:MAG: SBBP repeat-containing protein, partial [Anaerolineae bacterium]|nr:SBBP repeat-containing protein [Anaerolineae bacterium]
SPVQATCGRFDNWTCSTDAFVVKLPPAGDDLLFSTYLGGSAANGGSGTDIGRAIAVDSSGTIFVGGETFAGDFPVVNAFQNQKRGQNNFSDGFVARLDRQGAGYRLAYS